MVNALPLRTALVTGGAQRVGAAISADLAANGWAVAIHVGQSRAAGEALAAKIVASGGQAAVVAGDLGDPQQLGAIVPAASRALGPPQLLVNNAATFDRDEFGALDREVWDRQMAINLTAPVFLAEAMAARLPDGQEGNVVNMLDQRVLKPLPVYASYQLAKSALFTATHTLAQALAPRVRVNALALGPILPHAEQPDADFSRKIAAVPLRRGVDMAEIGRAIRFLVDCRSITGQTIALDGGQHLAWLTPDLSEFDETP
ncbi:MAG: SDR family oxidoreductase [Alphaproteobacteria bacterium]